MEREHNDQTYDDKRGKKRKDEKTREKKKKGIKKEKERKIRDISGLKMDKKR